MFKVWGEITYEPSTFSCTATKFEDPNQWGSPLIIFAIIGFMLPLVIACISFLLIKIKIRRTRDTVISSIMESRVFGPIIKQEQAVTKTFFIVIGSYVVLVFPAVLVIIIDPMPPGKADIPGEI